MTTNDLTKSMELEAPKHSARLYRNNTGLGWVGEAPRREGNAITLHNPRPLHAGLCEGSSDLIGWTTLEITPDMVGRKVAVFTAVEVKNGSDRPTKVQRAFIAAVKAQGGLAGIARNVNDAVAIVKSFPHSRVDSK